MRTAPCVPNDTCTFQFIVDRTRARVFIYISWLALPSPLCKRVGGRTRVSTIIHNCFFCPVPREAPSSSLGEEEKRRAEGSSGCH